MLGRDEDDAGRFPDDPLGGERLDTEHAIDDTIAHPDSSDSATLRDLRRVRREIRLGDTEWFDVLYRVYLFALVGSIVVVFASDAVAGVLDDNISTDQLLSRGPSIAGVAVALAFGIGLRNGADGGPVSIEAADIRHVLLAPISRQRVLLRPIVQRLRSVMFGLALVLGILGQFVAREVEGSRAAWAASAALFGAIVGATYVATAVVSHALRVPRALASVVAGVAVGWQAVVAWRIWYGEARGIARVGPANLDGSLLFWGIRQRGVDVLAIVAVFALIAGALALGGKLRLEPLERRGQLVSQLRFAATVQDIRTVVLLRRQLRAESVRARPWLSRAATRTPHATPTRPTTRPARREGTPRPIFVWRRGLIALRRLPIGRIARIAALAAVGGACASAGVSTTPLLFIGFVIAVFLVGLESLEPLAQEIDRPDLTDGIPIDRSWLFVNHLVAPAGLLALAGLVGAAAAAVVEPAHAAGAFVLAVPLAWAGAIGAIVTTVRDAPQPVEVATTTITGADRGADSPFAMPEFAGFSNVITGAIPIVLSAIAAVPLLALSADPSSATIGRSIVGLALCLVATVLWILRRDRWAIKLRAFFAAGRAESGLTTGVRP